VSPPNDQAHHASASPVSASRARALAGAVAALAVLVTAGLVAGCSAGQVAQTAAVRAQEGTNAQQGDIALRNAFVEYPGEEGVWEEGSDVALVMRLVNESGTADRLVGVTTPDAEAVVLVRGPRPSPTGTGPAPGSGEETGAASPAGSGSPPPPIGMPSRSAAPRPPALPAPRRRPPRRSRA